MRMQNTNQERPLKRFAKADRSSVDQDGRYTISDRTYAKNRERVDALYAYDAACSKALHVIQGAVRDVHVARAALGPEPEQMDEKMAFVMEWSVDAVASKIAGHVNCNLLHLNNVLESLKTGWPYGMCGKDLKGYLRDEAARLKKAKEINRGRDV